LREFERSRLMVWTALGRRERGRRGPRRRRGEPTRIVGQGELVRERAWPLGEQYVPLSLMAAG